MLFPAAIIASIIITLTSVFTVYKLFLDKPLPLPPPVTQTVNSTPAPSSTQKPENSPIPTTTAKPKASPIKSTIGTLTVLQNNPNNQVSSSTVSTISGSISLAGTPPSGSSLVIEARETGSNAPFQTVVSGIPALNNATWSWENVKKGVRYDVFAVLKGKSGAVDIDYASSLSSTVTAPFKGQVLVVNIGYILAAPSGTITTSCNTHLSSNQWAAAVNFPQINDALMYNLQIGTTSGSNDLVEAVGNTQTVNAVLNDSVVYYAQYAVAVVSHPTPYQYSAFSTPQIIRCP